MNTLFIRSIFITAIGVMSMIGFNEGAEMLERIQKMLLPKVHDIKPYIEDRPFWGTDSLYSACTDDADCVIREPIVQAGTLPSEDGGR